MTGTACLAGRPTPGDWVASGAGVGAGVCFAALVLADACFRGRARGAGRFRGLVAGTVVLATGHKRERQTACENAQLNKVAQHSWSQDEP